MLWWLVSIDFEKSIRSASVTSLLLIARLMSSLIFKRIVVVECPFRKPDCVVVYKDSFSIKLHNCYKFNFERIGRTEIDRKSLTDVSWSTCGTGQTLAIF